MTGSIVLPHHVAGSRDARARLEALTGALVDHGYAATTEDAIDLLAQALAEPTLPEVPC